MWFVIAIILAIVCYVFYQQLIKWKNWKDAIDQWITDYQTWIAQNCECDHDDPPLPPDPPTWPNGGWQN